MSDHAAESNVDKHQRRAMDLIEQGKAALLEGNQLVADHMLIEAITIYQAIGDSYSIAAQTGNYGWALRRAGQPERARSYLLQAADLFAALGIDDFAERHRVAADADAPLATPDMLDGLPPAVRSAIERNDLSGLELALASLSANVQQAVFAQLEALGIISDAANDDTADEALQQFDLLLQDIAAVACGDDTNRAEIEMALTEIERKGWGLRQPTLAIWAGQRDLAALTAGLDPVDARLVQRILELIAAR